MTFELEPDLRETLDSEWRVGRVLSMLEKLNLFCLAGRITHNTIDVKIVGFIVEEK